MKIVTFPCVICLFLMSFTSNAHAYLDPGTGSIVLQAILGGAAVALATGSMYLQRVKSFFTGKKPDQTEDHG